MTQDSVTSPAFSHVTLIGCGKMGQALLQGWIDAGIAQTYTVIDPQGLPEPLQTHSHISFHASAGEAGNDLAQTDIVVLAVKPQVMEKICADLKPALKDSTLILSIAAGTSLNSLENYLGARPVVRSMPNTPAAIKKGMTVAVVNSHVNDRMAQKIDSLLRCVGKVAWLKDETLLNAVTALSGSGPAYVFYLIETLAKAGEKQGLPPETAMILARQTVIGSAALAETKANIPASRLRENVTSPGGTTEAALKILMNGEMEDVFSKALAAATRRGAELDQS